MPQVLCARAATYQDNRLAQGRGGKLLYTFGALWVYQRFLTEMFFCISGGYR